MGCTGFIVNPLLLIGVAVLVVLLVLIFRKRREEEPVATLRPQPQEAAGEAGNAPAEEDFETLAEEADRDIAADPAIREYPFSKLEYLSIAGGWQLHMQCNASANSCRIGIDPAFARFVKVEESRNGLLIRYTGRKTPVEAMTIEISTTGMPAQFKSIGKSRVWVDAAEGGKFVCKITDGGEFEMPGAKLGELILKLTGECRAECGGDFNSAEIEVSDRSNAKLRGAIGTLAARLSGASKGEAVRVGKADIAVSGASKLKLEVTDELEGDLSGGSSLKYRGEIDTSGVRISGSSRLKNWN
ncbi:MAG: hypothetical protein HPZ91_12690 [Lentisphaeria bacterium]|nr:hypothetical protein [Lentisphaeria bacterium]